MKSNSIKLTNYIGVNGVVVDTTSVDFIKCKDNIITEGDNSSSKSFKALTLQEIVVTVKKSRPRKLIAEAIKTRIDIPHVHTLEEIGCKSWDELGKKNDERIELQRQHNENDTILDYYIESGKGRKAQVMARVNTHKDS